MNIIVLSVIVLGSIGLISGLILFFTAKKFKVNENPKIEEVEKILPNANCGACGYTGCHNFAEAAANSETLDSLFCPVGGNEVMAKVAQILGKEVETQNAQVAVVRCSGSIQFRERTSEYEGPKICAIESALYSSDTDCQYGCLGLGDCVEACNFDAIVINPETMLPVVNEDKCTACGACVEACPRDIIELRPKGPKNRRIYVSCMNEDKGGKAKQYCEVACIGCKACVQACKFDAITVDNFLATIHADACRLCRACVEVCPTNAILEVNFPPRKTKQISLKDSLKNKNSKN